MDTWSLVGPGSHNTLTKHKVPVQNKLMHRITASSRDQNQGSKFFNHWAQFVYTLARSVSTDFHNCFLLTWHQGGSVKSQKGLHSSFFDVPLSLSH